MRRGGRGTGHAITVRRTTDTDSHLVGVGAPDASIIVLDGDGREPGMRQRHRWWVDGVPLGRVMRVPLFVAPSWLLSVLLIMYVAGPVVHDLVPGLSAMTGYLVGAALGVFLGVSVLLHELGHCVAARRVGLPVRSVRLFLLGGVSEIARLPRTPGEEAQIAAAGPVVSVILTGMFAAMIPVTEPHTITWLLVIQLCLANALIAVFNLIPALPLDGGRVLRAAIWKLRGRRGAGTAAGVIGGYLVALALIAWSVALFFDGGRPALLQAVVVLAMAGFVAAGAASERPRTSTAGPAAEPLTLRGLSSPAVLLPLRTPLTAALFQAQGRDILLTAPHGAVVAVVDLPAAMVRVAGEPDTPAESCAQAIGPEQVILSQDTFREVMDVMGTSGAEYYLLIGPEGQTIGVLRRSVVLNAVIGS